MTDERDTQAWERYDAEREPQGVWLVFFLDYDFKRVIPFDNELKARRYAMDESCSVKFVKWGEPL